MKTKRNPLLHNRHVMIFWATIASTLLILPIMFVLYKGWNGDGLLGDIQTFFDPIRTQYLSVKFFNRSLQYQRSDFLIILLLGAVPGFLIAIVQRRLLRRYLYIDLKRWEIFSAAGGILGLILFVCFNLVSHDLIDPFLKLPLHFGSTYIMPALLLGISLTQVIVLRRYATHVWLWIVLNLVAGVLFATVTWLNGTPRDDNVYLVLHIVASGALGISMAVMMFGYFVKYRLRKMNSAFI